MASCALVAREDAHRLVERGLIRTRIDLQEELPFLHVIALPEGDLREQPADLRDDGDGLQRFGSARPVDLIGKRLPHGLGHGDGNPLRGASGALVAAGREREDEGERERAA